VERSGGTECSSRLNSADFLRKFGRGEWIRTTDPSVPNRRGVSTFPKKMARFSARLTTG
jgi:hypothetical protein